MRFEFTIARRLFGERTDARRISRPAVRIAVWGVAVGLAVMLLSVFIVRGFKREIRAKAIGFGGHIQVMNTQTLFTGEASPVVVGDSLMRQLRSLPAVTHVQRFANRTGLFKTEGAFQGIVLRGVGEEYDTLFLAAHLLAGRMPRFSSTEAANEVLISSRQAATLGLDVGSRVFAYFFAGELKARRFDVVGIYQTHLRDFDDAFAFTALATVVRLNGWEDDQCSGAELLTADYDDIDATATAVATLVNRTADRNGDIYTSATLAELHPGIFSWLSLLDTNVYVILVLMIGISIFTMTSGLLIIILERTNFIAVMKSMGATNTQLRRVFLAFAALIIGRGMLMGNAIGLALALAQQQWGIVHLDPATYYVDAVPVSISWLHVAAINAATLTLSLAVLIVPTYLVARIHPARVMRFD
ncbi:MAG: ABC transporter permease [Bacteroidaceae bacterium]|nr:ABC transporter permease [Bacteroidaceae bacterium]